MDAIKTSEYARALLASHGARAMLEAARRMRECQQIGKTDEARDWEKIRLALSEMRGPHQA